MLSNCDGGALLLSLSLMDDLSGSTPRSGVPDNGMGLPWGSPRAAVVLVGSDDVSRFAKMDLGGRAFGIGRAGLAKARQFRFKVDVKDKAMVTRTATMV